MMSEELKPCFTERDMFLIRESFRAGQFYFKAPNERTWLNQFVADNGGTVEQLLAYEAGEITAADVPESVKREIQAEALDKAAEDIKKDGMFQQGTAIAMSGWLYAEAARLREGE